MITNKRSVKGILHNLFRHFGYDIVRIAPTANKTILYRDQRPWDEGYSQRKENLLRGILSNPYILETFKTGKRLPDQFGIGVDERCIEYPWVFTHINIKTNTLLDAGSTLNHAFLVDIPFVKDRKLHIITLSPEEECYYYNRISYIFDDLRDLPIKDSFYDAIICISTLEHIGFDNSIYTNDQKYNENDPEAFVSVMKEFRRVLKPNGELFVTVPYGLDTTYNFFRQFDSSLIERAIAAFGERCELLSYYIYTSQGWQIATSEECRNAEYVEWIAKAWGSKHWPDTIPVELDLAAAARAVACIKFMKIS